MLTAQLKTKIINRVLECLSIVSSKTGESFAEPTIHMDLKGHQAGQAIPGQWLLRFNPIIAKQDPERFVHEVSAHEVAHLVTYKIWKTLDHGSDFKKVMEWLQVKANRCHDFKSEPSRIIRRFDYSCSCTNHRLTTIRHNRILKGQSYRCRNCGDVLLPI